MTEAQITFKIEDSYIKSCGNLSQFMAEIKGVIEQCSISDKAEAKAEALRRYVRHDSDCEVRLPNGVECTCGLWLILQPRQMAERNASKLQYSVAEQPEF